MHERVKVLLCNGQVKHGVIIAKRYAPPEFNKVEAYSVLLDEKRHMLGYAGSMFPSHQVTILLDQDA